MAFINARIDADLDGRKSCELGKLGVTWPDLVR